jgi:hypothetical protein
MKVLGIVWRNVISPALALYLIYALGYYWAWAGGMLAGLALGLSLGYVISKELKT